jgi:hypothetical protein
MYYNHVGQCFLLITCLDLKGRSNRRLITIDEVKQHNSEGSMWTVLKGGVYDISPYMKYHPGGACPHILILTDFLLVTLCFSIFLRELLILLNNLLEFVKIHQAKSSCTNLLFFVYITLLNILYDQNPISR